MSVIIGRYLSSLGELLALRLLAEEEALLLCFFVSDFPPPVDNVRI